MRILRMFGVAIALTILVPSPDAADVSAQSDPLRICWGPGATGPGFWSAEDSCRQYKRCLIGDDAFSVASRVASCDRVLAMRGLRPVDRADVLANRSQSVIVSGTPTLIARAHADYEEAMRLNPEYAGSYLRDRGEVYAENGHTALAIADFEAALARGGDIQYTNQSGLYIDLGEALAQANEHTRAIEAFNRALAVSPDRSVYISRGKSYRALLRLPEALADFETEIARGDSVEARYQRGHTYWLMGEYAQAITDFDYYIAEEEAMADEGLSDGPSLEAYVLRAFARVDNRDYAVAITELTELMGQFQADARWYAYRGRAYAAQRDYPRAIRDFDQAIALDPSRSRTFMHRADAHRFSGNQSGAEADYSEAIRLEPGLSSAWHERGRIRLRQGNFGGAIADQDQALTLLPSGRGYPLSRCRTRAEWGQQLDLALLDCDAALGIGQGANAAGYTARGLVQLRRGDFSAALVDFEEALERAPYWSEALYGRGIARRRLGQSEAADADIAAATAADPTLPGTYAGYGLTP